MPLKDVAGAVRKLQGSVLVLTHHNADIDAVASAVALATGLRQLGLNTTVGVAESVAKAARRISEGREIVTDPDCSTFDNVVLVDTSVPEQLASVKNLHVEIVIDHHPAGPLTKSAETIWIEPFAKSTAQMIYALLKELDCEVDKGLAKVIAAGIVADTAHLRFAGLPEFETMTELLRTGADFSEVLNMISTPTDPSDTIAGLKAAAHMKLWKVGDVVVAVSKLGSHEAPAARALVRLGADVAIVAAVKDEEVRISSRARESIGNYGIDLSEIFKKVGEMVGGTGGGHPTAGSANGSDTGKVDDALDYAVKAITKAVGKPCKKLD